MVADCGGTPPCSVTRTIDDVTYKVDFDAFGNVDFR